MFHVTKYRPRVRMYEAGKELAHLKVEALRGLPPPLYTRSSFILHLTTSTFTLSARIAAFLMNLPEKDKQSIGIESEHTAA